MHRNLTAVRCLDQTATVNPTPERKRGYRDLLLSPPIVAAAHLVGQLRCACPCPVDDDVNVLVGQLGSLRLEDGLLDAKKIGV